MNNALDDKVQMMDAGMAFFKSENGFDEESKRVAEIMASHSFPHRKAEVTRDDEGNLIMDYSNPFRRRYLSCHVEICDSGRYAVNIFEGNRNLPLKVDILIFCHLCLVIPSLFFFQWISCIIWIGVISWIFSKALFPSKLAQENVNGLLNDLKSESNRQE